jgi:hypothetical protein
MSFLLNRSNDNHYKIKLEKKHDIIENVVVSFKKILARRRTEVDI